MITKEELLQKGIDASEADKIISALEAQVENSSPLEALNKALNDDPEMDSLFKAAKKGEGDEDEDEDEEEYDEKFMKKMKKYMKSKGKYDGKDEEPDDDSDEFSEWENKMIIIEDEFLKSLLEDYSIILQKEYEYQTSEEAIIESIKANDYEFTEDGKLA